MFMSFISKFLIVSYVIFFNRLMIWSVNNQLKLKATLSAHYSWEFFTNIRGISSTHTSYSNNYQMNYGYNASHLSRNIKNFFYRNTLSSLIPPLYGIQQQSVVTIEHLQGNYIVIFIFSLLFS